MLGRRRFGTTIATLSTDGPDVNLALGHRGQCLNGVVQLRFCDTTTEAGRLAREECRREGRSVSPLPYGGSDRVVVLRSLPISTLHALLLVACTMVFFVVLASAQGDDHGVAKGHVPILSPAMVTPGAWGAMGRTSDGSAGSHRSRILGNQNVGDMQSLMVSRSVALSHATDHDALGAISSRRETPDMPRLSAMAVSHLLVVIPTVLARRAVSIISESYSVQSANLPRLS